MLKNVTEQYKNLKFLKIKADFFFTFRLVSAFRDKLERCHGLDPCILETNW